MSGVERKYRGKFLKTQQDDGKGYFNKKVTVMKRISFFVAVLMIAMCICPAFSYATDGGSTRVDKTAHAIYGTPEIDGVIEALWDKAEMHTLADTTDFKARFRTMWDEDYIYLLYEVKDVTMMDDNGTYEKSISETDNSINTGTWSRNGITYLTASSPFVKCDAIGFAFAPSDNTNGAPGFTGYVGLYGTVSHREFAWTNTFYEVAQNGSGASYYKSWFETTIVRDYSGNAVGYIMEGKVDVAQHGYNWFDNTLNDMTYQGYGYTADGTYGGQIITPKSDYSAAYVQQVGKKLGFAALINDGNGTTSSTSSSRKAAYAWQKDNNPNNDAKQQRWNTLELVEAAFVSDNTGYESYKEYFGLEYDTRYEMTQAAKGTPTVDGDIDDIWNDAEVNYIYHSIASTGNAKAPKVRFRVMWDDDYLYFLYEVADKNVTDAAKELAEMMSGNYHTTDSVVLAFSPDYNRTPTAACTAPAFYFTAGLHGCIANWSQAPDGVFRSGVDSSVWGGYSNESQRFFHTKLITDENGTLGYVMEGKVDLKARLNTVEMTAGTTIGFDTYINDSNNGTTPQRENFLSWIGEADTYKDDSRKGTIMLADDDFVADKSKLDEDFFQSDVTLSNVQVSKPVSGKYALRFVATVDLTSRDLNGCEGVGIEITNGERTWKTVNIEKVYKNLTAYRGMSAVAQDGNNCYTAYTLYDVDVDMDDSVLLVKTFKVIDGITTYDDELIQKIEFSNYATPEVNYMTKEVAAYLSGQTMSYTQSKWLQTDGITSGGTTHKAQQGGCTDGTYVYLSYRNSKNESSIEKIRLSDGASVKTAFNIGTGHANDLCYNSRTNKIIAAENVLNCTTDTMTANVKIINPSTLQVEETKQIVTSSPQISTTSILSYNAARDVYVCSGGGYFFILDNEFRMIRKFAAQSALYTYQGSYCDDMYIYSIQSAKPANDAHGNVVYVYDWHGNFVQLFKFKDSPMTSDTMESEDMFIIGDALYAVCYDQSNKYPVIYKCVKN